MKVLLVLATLIIFSASSPVSNKEWDDWKILHSKEYVDEEDEYRRYLTWMYNKQYIEDHNLLDKDSGFTLAMNEFGDLNNSEFASIYNGYRRISTDHVTYYKPNGTKLPDTVDWRDQNIVTPAKNQGKCGSCWAFSTTGSLEGQHARKSGKLVSLSEQQLMDCSSKYGNRGCDGGNMESAFQYIKKNGGDDTEESYPYKAENETCRFNPKNIGATDKGYVKLPQGDEPALMDAVYNIGPISIGMDAAMQDFQFYHKGVYSNYGCSAVALDHGVLAIGYGTLNGVPYWLVKNSWGDKWGIKGFFMIARFVGNMCGIATDPSYPTV